MKERKQNIGWSDDDLTQLRIGLLKTIWVFLINAGAEVVTGTHVVIVRVLADIATTNDWLNAQRERLARKAKQRAELQALIDEVSQDLKFIDAYNILITDAKQKYGEHSLAFKMAEALIIYRLNKKLKSVGRQLKVPTSPDVQLVDIEEDK